MGKIKQMLDALFPNFTCVACGGEIITSDNRYLCTACIEKLPFAPEQDKNRLAPFLYEEPIRSVILKLKYGDNGFAARAVSPYMAAVYLKLNAKAKTARVVVPVPLCSARAKERGYNQSEVLAREVGEYLGFPVVTNALIRIKKTAPQKNMTPSERAENMKGAFAVDGKNGENIKNKHILLIDDVFTTGATAGECIKVLKSHGVKSVTVLTVAKTS